MKEKRKVRLLIIGIVLLTSLVSFLVANKVENKKYAGKIRVENVEVKKATNKKKDIEKEEQKEEKTKEEKTKEEKQEIKEDVVNTYSTQKYIVNYTLKSEKSIKTTAVVKVKIAKEDTKYVSFVKKETDKVTSTILEDGTVLVLEIKDVKTNTPNSEEIEFKINNAPDGYKVNPVIEVMEKTSEKVGVKVSAPGIEIKTTSISGKLIDKETGEKIKNEEVILYKIVNGVETKEKSTYTNEEGEYVFSDLIEGSYKVKSLNGEASVDVTEGNTPIDVVSNIEEKFNASIKKYVKEIVIKENGEEKEYEFKDAKKAAASIKGNNKAEVEIEYSFVIENTGNAAGYVKVIKENIPEGFEKVNDKDDWLKEGEFLYNKTLGRERLQPKEKKELTLRLKSKGEISAKEYINKVSIRGEEYHTVKYIVDDEIVKEMSVVDSDKVEPINYEKSTESLEGWYKDKDFKEEFNFNTPIEKDTIIYGKVIGTENIKVHYIDQDVEIKTEEVKRGEKLNAPKEVEEENHYIGHIFKHWSLEKNGESYDLEKGTKKEITLYAVYDKKTYEVEYYDEINENEYSYIKTEKVKYEENLKEVPELSKDHYIFKGFKEENGEIINVETYKVTKNIKLYAVYEEKEYEIEFYDGEIKLIEESKYKATQIINEPNTEKEKYKFIGWETIDGQNVRVKNENRNYFAYEVFEENNLEENKVKLYAKYERNTFTVKFIDVDPVTKEETEIHKEDVVYEESVKEIPDVHKEYYNFLGWSVEKDNKDKIKDNINTIKVIEDTVYYAVYEIKKYKMTFIDKDEIDESVLDAGSIVTEKDPNIEEGYNFLGWFKGEEKQEFPLTLLEDTTVEAKYEKKKYEVKFIDVDPKTNEETILDTIEIEHGNLVSETENAQIVKEKNHKEGFVFKEWVNSEKQSFDFTKEIKSNTNIYSSYTKIKNGVIFDDENRITEKEVEYGEKVEEIESQGKKGHTFKYWSEDKTNAFDFNTPIIGSKRLYAIYESNSYKLTIDPKGGLYEGSADVKEYTLKYEEEKEIAEPSKKGYTFTGWTVSVENVFSENKVTMPDSDVTLTANYEKNSYKLTIDPNGGLYEESDEIKEYTLKYEEEKEISEPSKEGYTFTGWTVSVENVFSENKVTMPDSDVTLTANYEIISHTLTIDPNGGEYKGDSLTYTLNYNEEKILEISEKEGFTFTGYKVISGNGIYNEDRRFQMKTEDTTLQAMYRENTYKVKYTAEDATGEMGTDEFRFTEVKNLSKNKFKKEGYTFTGWIDEETNTEYIDEEEVYSLRSEDGAIVTLKAKFRPNKYRVVYSKCDELVEGTMEDSEFTYDERGNLRENAYTKQGHDFKGWSLKDEEGIAYQDGEEILNLSNKDNDVVELCAVFESNDYKVTYIDESEEYYREFVKYGETAKGPKNAEGESIQPSKEGKEFIGWYSNLEDEIPYNFETAVIEDITLYSKYKEMEIPQITGNPSDWTNGNVEITVSTKEGYTTEYKIVKEGVSNYLEYTSPFEVEENSTVKARYKKKNEYSNEAEFNVKNIDKIDPILEEEKIEVIDSNYNDVSLQIKTKDENSRVKNIKVYLDENNDEIGSLEEKKFEETYNIPGDFDNPGEEEITYTCKIDNLVEGTIYKVIIEVKDFAGNVSKQIKEIETGSIVAEVIYKEGNEEITEENPMLFGKLQEAIDFCENNECTVRMIANTKETKTVGVQENQNIKLDLNGKTVSSELPSSTIENNGKLQIVEEESTEGIGKIENTAGVAINNKSNLIIGENEAVDENTVGSVVSEIKPYINGGNYGIVSSENSILKFYDGKIEGTIAAVNGMITGKPYLYNAQITSGERQVAVLKILQESEARVKRTQSYYTKVSNAIGSTNNGIKESQEQEENLIDLIETNSTTDYGFTKDIVPEEAYVLDLSGNNNNGIIKSKTHEENKTGITGVDAYNNNYISLKSDNYKTYEVTFKEINDSTNYLIKNNDINLWTNSNHVCMSTIDYEYCVNIEGRTLNEIHNAQVVFNKNDVKVYYDGELIGTRNNSTYNPKMDRDIFIGYNSLGTIYNVRMYDRSLSEEEVRQNYNISKELYKTEEQMDLVDEFVTNGLKVHYETKQKGSVQQKANESLIQTNIGKANTNAQSYVKLDLRNKEVNQLLTVNAGCTGPNCNDYAFIDESSEDITKFDEEATSYELFHIGTNSTEINYLQNRDFTKVLEKGKLYYLHFIHKEGNNQAGLFQINKVTLRDYDIPNPNKIITDGDYGFKYQEDGTIVAENPRGKNSTAKGHMEFDLTDSEANKLLTISAEGETGRYNSISIWIDEEAEEEHTNKNELYSGSEMKLNDKIVMLEKGKKYHLHFEFNSTGASDVYFKINSISLNDVSGVLEEKEVHGSNFALINTFDLEDLSANNNNTINMGAVYDEEKNSLKLDGRSGVNVGAHDFEKNITLETEFSADDYNSGETEILTNFESGGYGIYLYNGKITGTVHVGGSYREIVADSTVNIGEKYNVSMTYDGNILKLYINGALEGTYEIEGVINAPTSSTKLFLGANPYGDTMQGDFFTGNIYSSRLYSKVLTEEEINYNINNSEKLEDSIEFNYDFKRGKSISIGNKQYKTISDSDETSYMEIDLTEETEDKILHAEGYTTGRRFYVYLDEDLEKNSNCIFDNYNSSKAFNFSSKLEKGKKYYLKFGIYSGSSDIIINQLNLNSLNTNEITLGEKNETNVSINEIPKLNEEADTVELLKNIDLTEPLTVENTRKMVLDLRGYTLSTNSNDYIIKNSGDLEIIDSKYTNDIENAKEEYDKEQAENQLVYEEEMAQYETDKQNIIDKYNKEYNDKMDSAIREYELTQENYKEYEELLNKYNSTHFDFNYTGNVQEFVAPKTGYYKLEVWGAKGGYRSDSTKGGNGGYSKGTIHLDQGDKLYIYVGGSGNTGGTSGGYNGGGSRPTYNGGGGATDIRLISGEWNSNEGLLSRIIVAGGGGSDGASNRAGGSGGGLEGTSATDGYGVGGEAGTQSAGNALGAGGSGTDSGGGYAGAGGGGWYGGYGSTPDSGGDDDRGGGGGSGFINIEGATVPEGYSASDYVLTDALTQDGTQTIPSYDGKSIITGNKEDGHAFITMLNEEGNEDENENPGKYGENNYNYTGNVQKFIAPSAGNYKIEAWGASGGKDNFSGTMKENYGNGGYTKGEIKLKKGDELYIYVGQRGLDGVLGSTKTTDRAYNGGGAGVGSSDNDDGSGSGGGATDIRLYKSEDGAWDNFDSLKSRIMVAAGGAGGGTISSYDLNKKAGHGGGLTGVGQLWVWQDSQSNKNLHATQTSGYKFGQGQDGTHAAAAGSGGGGGYYGGLADTDTYLAATGGGGSSFISGHEGCDAIDESSTEDNIIHTGNSTHYSNYVFTNTEMIDGEGYKWTTEKGEKVGIPNQTLDGHAKITLAILDTVSTKTYNNINLTDNIYQIDLEKEQTITNYKIYGNNETTNPTHIEILGSNDNINFEKIKESDLTFNDSYSEISINKGYDSYRYYKLNFTGNSENINIEKITVNVFDISREKFQDTEIDISSEKFASAHTGNSGYDFAGYRENENDIYISTAYADKYGEVYYNDIFQGSASVSGTATVWHDTRDMDLGKLYIGFAKTNENRIDDFIEYKEIDITSSTHQSVDFDIKASNGKYYFKVINYHNSAWNGYITYASITNLKIKTSALKKPVLQQAVLKESTLTGNITSASGDLILNNKNANLKVSEANINVNAKGITGIRNDGNLVLEKDSMININDNNSKGVVNAFNGTMESKNSIFNINMQLDRENYSYGIYDLSIKQKNYKDINIYLNCDKDSYGRKMMGIYLGGVSSNILDNINVYDANPRTDLYNSFGPYAIYNDYSSKSVVLKNSYTEAPITNNKGIMNVENGKYLSMENNSKAAIGINEEIYPELKYIKNTSEFLMNYAKVSNDYDYQVIDNTKEFTMKNGTIDSKGSGINLSSAGIFNLEDGQIIAKTGGIYIHDKLSTLNMNGGTINANRGIIGNYGNANIHKGTILYNDYGIISEGRWYGLESLIIDGDVTIKNKDNTKGTAIRVGENNLNSTIKGHVTIEGETVIDLRGLGDRCRALLTLGEKDGEVDSNYPRLKGNIGVNANDASFINVTTNFYDGRIISENKKQLDIISDIEEGFELTYETNPEDNNLEDLYLGEGSIDVAEINSTKYNSVKKAFEAANEMTDEEITIKLLKDITSIEDNVINNDKNIIFDLNGYKMNLLTEKDYFINNGNLQIIDSSAVKTGDTVTLGSGEIVSQKGNLFINNKNLQIDAGTYTINMKILENNDTAIINNGNFKLGIYSDNTWIINSNSAKNLTINGGNLSKEYGHIIINESESNNAVVINGGYLETYASDNIYSEVGTITVKNGTISNHRVSFGRTPAVIRCYKNCLLNVTGGNLINNGAVIYLNEGSTANISKGNIEDIEISSSSTANVTGGNINAIRTYNSYSYMNISGGEIEQVTNENGEATVSDGKINYVYNNSNMVITGGTFENSGEKYRREVINNNTKGFLTIIGGTITNNVPTGSNKEDYSAIRNTGTLTLGSKGKANETDENIVLNVPKVTSAEYCTIVNKGTSKFYYYDGTLKGPENYVICDTVNEIEDKYSMISNVEDGMTTITLELAPVAKVNETNYYSLEEAFSDSTCTDECVIELMQDISRISENALQILDTQNITLDLNGHTITSEYTLFENNGIFSIDDSTKVDEDGIISGKGQIRTPSAIQIINNENSKLTITSGYYSPTKEWISNNGELIINNGKMERKVYDDTYTITNRINGSVTINGGYLENNTDGSRVLLNESSNESALVINGGSINAHNTSWSGIGITSTAGNVKINDGNLDTFIDISENSKLDVKNGTISYIRNRGVEINIYNGIIEQVDNLFKNEITNIYDGEFKRLRNSSTNGIINLYNGRVENDRSGFIENNAGNTINIGTKGDLKDGNLNVNTEKPEIVTTTTYSGRVFATNNFSSVGTVNFYDGVIKSKSNESLKPTDISKVEEGYRLKKFTTEEYNEIYYLVREPLVEVNGNNYYSVKEALESTQCSSSCTIKYLDDYIKPINEESINIESGKNVTIDINGFTINVGSKYLQNNGTLKIIDTATEKGQIKQYAYETILENIGNLEIDGATLFGDLTLQSITNKGNLTITAGTVTGITNSSGKVIVNGGTINGYKFGYYNETRSIYNEEYGVIEVNNGTINGTTAIVNEAKGLEDGTPNIIINGGTLQGDIGIYASSSNISPKSLIVINDGLIESLYSGTGIDVLGCDNIQINGGTFKSNGNAAAIQIRSSQSEDISIKNAKIISPSKGIYCNSSSSLDNSYKIEGVTFEGSVQTPIHNERCNMIISNSTINGTETAIINNSNLVLNNNIITGPNNTITNKGVLTINDGNVSGGTTGINNTGTLNIGNKGKMLETDLSVIKDTPVIEGTEYGVLSIGIINFYDGVVKGQIGKSYSGTINEVEPGYLIRRVEEEGREKTQFEMIGTEDRTVGLPDYNLNFNDLQAAINSVSDGIETKMYLYQSITLDKDIVVPSGKNIQFYYNGNSINKNGYSFTIEDGAVFTEVDKNDTSLLGQILELLNIGKKKTIEKNVVIYELDNGEKLNSANEYKLQVLNKGKYVDVDLNEELENIGRYEISTKKSDETLRTINGNVYINKLPNGDYRVIEIGNEEKALAFSIEEDGTINGNVKENYQSKEVTGKDALSISSANVILNIQTGQKIIRYGLIFVIISSIISVLVILRRKLRN